MTANYMTKPITGSKFNNFRRIIMNITFEFDKPVFLLDVGLIDVDESAQKLVFQYADGRSEVFTFHGLGDNSVQRVIANKFRVKKLVVVLQGTAGVTVLNYCPGCLL
jgi:hypothetical protein